jgi:hypothetical protein
MFCFLYLKYLDSKLKKLEKSKLYEIDEEKRSIFDREKFIESSSSIKEILENLFEKHVQNAK